MPLYKRDMGKTDQQCEEETEMQGYPSEIQCPINGHISISAAKYINSHTKINIDRIVTV